MKRLTRLSVLLMLLAVCAGLAAGQGFEVRPNSSAPERPAGSEIFVSTEGLFSISLPKEVSGFSPASGQNISGASYEWQVKEGAFTASYTDMPRQMESISKQVFDNFRQRLTGDGETKLRVVSERDLTLDGHPGHEFRVEFPGGFGLSRVYLVGNRGYQVIVSLPLTKKEQEPSAIRILDSFKLLSQAEVEAEIKRKVAEATPSPLPQEPVAKKAKSDAEDEGLKGKVKTVFTESEDLSGTWAVAGRKPSSMDYYNERGNLTKQELYDYRGQLFDITVYGYLDGERVINKNWIQYEYNPPPMLIADAPGQAAAPKADPRYSHRYRYKYDDKGRLIEELMYMNNGRLWLRYVYKYQDGRKEKLAYSEDGALNLKSLMLLDDKGNEKEKTYFDIKSDAVSERYSYAYEFDEKGNWIKRATSKWTTKDGKNGFTPYSTDYRTLTYY